MAAVAPALPLKAQKKIAHLININCVFFRIKMDFINKLNVNFIEIKKQCVFKKNQLQSFLHGEI